VYVGGGDGYLVAVDAPTGVVKWKFAGLREFRRTEHAGATEISAEYDSSPAVVNGVVYVGGSIRGLEVDYASPFFAVDAGTGRELWRYVAERPIPSAPVVVDGVVYVISTDGQLVARDAATGKLRWDYSLPGRVWESPAVADGIVFAPGENQLVALDAATGRQVWAYNTDLGVPSTPAVHDGTVYIGLTINSFMSGTYGAIAALDSATGSKRWFVDEMPRISAGPAVSESGLYVGVDVQDEDLVLERQGMLISIDPASGHEQWRYQTNAPAESSPSVVGNKMYSGSSDGWLYGIDAATGTGVWRVDIGGRVLGSPAIANGIVYVTTDAGILVAVGDVQSLATPVAVSGMGAGTSSVTDMGGWPVFRGGPARTGEPTGIGPGPIGEPVERWSADFGTSVGGAATVVGNVAYMGVIDGGSGQLVAVEVQTGRDRWRADIPDFYGFSPAVVDGVVYFPGGQSLFAFGAETGALLWRVDGISFYASAVVANGAVIVPTSFGVVAVDSATGAERWRASFGAPGMVPVAVSSGLAVALSGGGAIIGLDVETGRELWRYPAIGLPYSAPAIVDGVVYTAATIHPTAVCETCAEYGVIFALDAETGSELWRYETESRVLGALAVHDGQVFAVGERDEVVALDAGTGARRWRFSSGGRSTGTPAVVGDVLYVGVGLADDSGALIAIEASTGAERWRYETPAAALSSPTVARGLVIFSDMNGYVYAIGDARPDPATPASTPSLGATPATG
jgi:outer membrane protein assembly factor BamB